ncbi:DUF6942 family protein [Simiduia aestuariiviva]|uniref:Uncharacterized protein n=1 Tax=Simiduia aestuariiviva TaxID=1510459 RepID=A0A839UM34_9GAMM|nr:hypothetical protein [Simiduia aestuariiviva]MBB3167620.1 hypothetical protein [Simiduia aestuariiviva]
MSSPALGGQAPALCVSIANCPPQTRYRALRERAPLAPGELADIVANSSNHWRKVFNVYAKLVYGLECRQPGWVVGDYGRWQAFRDGELLQAHSRQALLLGGAPVALQTPTVIAGKTWAQQLGMAGDLQWIDAHFAVYPGRPWVVCPYFDYRQLTNARIEQLIDIIAQWQLTPTLMTGAEAGA